MNSFNKTEAAVFSCMLCFLRAFHFIGLILLSWCFFGLLAYNISSLWRIYYKHELLMCQIQFCTQWSMYYRVMCSWTWCQSSKGIIRQLLWQSSSYTCSSVFNPTEYLTDKYSYTVKPVQTLSDRADPSVFRGVRFSQCWVFSVMCVSILAYVFTFTCKCTCIQYSACNCKSLKNIIYESWYIVGFSQLNIFTVHRLYWPYYDCSVLMPRWVAYSNRLVSPSLCQSVIPSVCRSVSQSVRQSVHPSVLFLSRA